MNDVKRTGESWSIRTVVKWLFVLLPFALPLYLVRFQVSGLPSTALEACVGLLLVTFTAAYGWSGWKKGWQRLGPWRWPIVAWFIVSLISVFVSPDIFAGLGLWRAYILEPLLVAVVASNLLKEKQYQEYLRTSFFALSIFLAFWAIVQFLTNWGIPHPWNVAIGVGRRAVGPFPYPNALALLVVPIAAWAFVDWLKTLPLTKGEQEGIQIYPRKSSGTSPDPSFARRGNLIALAAWVGGFVAVLLAKSDGGLIALLAVAWLAILLQKKLRPWLIGLTLAGALVLVAVPTFRTPILREVTFQGWSGQVRLFQWRETREMLKDHWFLGAGFGGYKTVFEPYHKATAIEIFQYPHNIILNFWTEMGLLGVLVFVWIVVTWFREGARNAPLRGRFVAVAPLVAILIHGIVDVPYLKNDLAIAFWLMVIILTHSNVQKE